MENNYIITQGELNILLKYIYTKPYNEVAQGIALLAKLPKLDPKINPSFVQDEKPKSK